MHRAARFLSGAASAVSKKKFGERCVQLGQLTELLGAGNAGTLGVVLSDGDGLIFVVDGVAYVLLGGSHDSVLSGVSPWR